jgi:hypothetical protein
VSAHGDPHQIGVAQLLDPHDPFVQFGGLIGLHEAVDHLADVGRSVGVIWPVATAFVRAAMMSAASRALVIGDNGNATGRSLRAGYILGSQSGHHGLVRPASSAAIAKSPAGVGWIPGPVRRDRKRGGLLYRLMAVVFFTPGAREFPGAFSEPEMFIADPLDDTVVDRNHMCRWSDVATAQARIHEQIEVLEDALLEISRRRIMDSVTAISMRAIATAAPSNH